MAVRGGRRIGVGIGLRCGGMSRVCGCAVYRGAAGGRPGADCGVCCVVWGGRVTCGCGRVAYGGARGAGGFFLIFLIFFPLPVASAPRVLRVVDVVCDFFASTLTHDDNIDTIPALALGAGIVQILSPGRRTPAV